MIISFMTAVQSRKMKFYTNLNKMENFMIKQNIEQVLENIKQACKKANRNPSEVTLIAVSKTKPVEDLQEAFNCGMTNFGENKVQELCEKYDFFNNPNFKFHMIGHLQTNKVKYIIDKVCLIHSVDSLNLAKKISDQAVKNNITAQILIEVNVGEEESKFGVCVEETLPLIEDISSLPNINIRGLMTVAPYVENPEENRGIFRRMKELSIAIKEKNINNTNMDILSMGMTNDYEVAIEEGSTMVRVGTGIFGNRIYDLNM